MALHLQEFQKDELPQVYERYRNKYELQTHFENLGFNVRRLIKDPLMLWLIAESYKGRKIPNLGFSVNRTYQEYIDQLEAEDRLVEDKDISFLMEHMVPLMAENDDYKNSISIRQTREHWISVQGLTEKIRLSELMRTHNTDKLKTEYIRLLDVGILKEEGDLRERAISFRIERFYEFFLGKHIQKEEVAILPDAEAKIAKFQELVDKVKGIPYLWGAVRQALVMDKEHRNDILKQLAQTDDRTTRNMIVDCLTALARDEDEVSAVCGILSHFVGLEGKSEAVQNSKNVAIQVAAELYRVPELVRLDSEDAKVLSDVLEKAVYDKSGQVRSIAYEHIYYLSMHNPDEVLRIIDKISGNIKFTWRIPRFIKSAMASGTISVLMYCDAFQASVKGQPEAQKTIDDLQKTWAKVIQECRRLLLIMLWIARNFSKLILQGEVGYTDPFNLYELNHFFRGLDQEEKDILIELTPYFTLERQDISSAEETIMTVARRSDMFSFYQIICTLTAQASAGNMDDALRIIERIYQDGSKFSKSHCSWALDSIMRIDNSRIDVYRELIERYLNDTGNWWTKSEVDKEYCSYAMYELINHHEIAQRSIAQQTLSKYASMARGDAKLLLCIIENMRALAIYCGHPFIAIGVLKSIINDEAFEKEMLLFSIRSVYQGDLKRRSISEGLQQEFRDKKFLLSQNAVVLSAPSGYLIDDAGSKRIYYIEKSKGELNVYSQITKRFVETLVDIKVHYPEMIEDILQSMGNGLSLRSIRIIRTAESSELLGHLIGVKLAFTVPQVVSKAPILRNLLADAIAAAAKCKNLGAWIDQFLRRVANRVAGKEILKAPPVEH